MAIKRESAAVATITCAVLVVYALRGGSYDVIVSGEAGIVAWWVLLAGLVTGFLPRSRPSLPAWLVLCALTLVAAWTALAFSWTQSDERTSIEVARVVHHLGLAALGIACLRRETATAAIAGATAAAAAVCGLAVASRLYPGPFPADAVREALGGNRLNYPLNYWNGLAAWGAMASAMALAWSVHARHAAARAAALAAVPLCLSAVYLTYSRAGALGVGIGVLVVLAASRTRLLVLVQASVAGLAALLAIRAVRGAEAIAEATGTGGRGTVVAALLAGMAVCAAAAAVAHRLGADDRLLVPRSSARPLALVGAVVAVVAGAIGLPGAIGSALDDFRTTTGVATDSADPAARLVSLSGNRRTVYRSALDAFAAEHLHGTGPGTFEFWWNRDAVDGESVREAHSVYVEALAEAGWPGLLLLLAFTAAALGAAVLARLRIATRAEAGAAVAALAVAGQWVFHAGVDWMWEITAVTGLAIVAVAAACAMRAERPVRVGTAARAGLAGLCLVALTTQLPATVGTAQIRASQRAVAHDDLGRARAAAGDAVAAWPWAASPYVQRALVAEAAGRYAAATSDARRAQAREPTNWRHPLLLARLAAERGDALQAVRAYRRARSLHPLGAAFNRR